MNKDTTEEKVKKKPISLPTKFRKLTKRYKELLEQYDYMVRTRKKYRNELMMIKKSFPTKFYKIQYKIMNDDATISGYQEIKDGFSIEHAIFKLIENKNFPQSFNLIDVKELK